MSKRRNAAPTSAGETTHARYRIIKLHDRSAFAWAVVESARGAIVVSTTGDLIFRLARDEAERIAAEMNAASGDPD